MFRVLSKPGPPPTSCRTCRRRRKKCDMTRPCCNRCLKGGYECLGYDYSQSRIRIIPNHDFIPVLETDVEDETTSKSNGSRTAALTQDCEDPNIISADYVNKSSILGAALRYRASASRTEDGPTGDSSNDYDRSWPQDQSQSIVCSPLLTDRSGRARSFDATSEPRSTQKGIFKDLDIYWTIPPSVNATQIKRNHFACVARCCIFQAIGAWFVSPTSNVRGHVFSQVGGRVVRAVYLGVIVVQAINQEMQHGPHDAMFQRRISQIDEFEQGLALSLRENAPLSDISDCLVAIVELVLLKFAVVDIAPGYNLLRAGLPRFYLLVAAEPDLLLEQPDGSLTVSFSRAVASSREALVRFVMVDVILTFLLGATPLVEYGYETTYQSDGFEQSYGIPTVLFKIVSQVSSWRAGSRVGLDDWQAMEQHVLSWRSLYTRSVDASAPENIPVERVMVGEVWRQVALIYIYMGMCGVSSHDLRVQASVDRIFELGEKMDSSRIGIHMLPHCIAVGVAARLEKHRVAIYKKLALFTNARYRLFCGAQFSRTLYHLWHGVGAGGGAVTWDDYVQSRQAVAPI